MDHASLMILNRSPCSFLSLPSSHQHLPLCICWFTLLLIHLPDGTGKLPGAASAAPAWVTEALHTLSEGTNESQRECLGDFQTFLLRGMVLRVTYGFVSQTTGIFLPAAQTVVYLAH